MIYLVYTSRATRDFSNGDLEELLQHSRVKNERNNLTGLLLYDAGMFMQLIEGPEDAVHHCFENIKRDARHTGVIQLIEKPLRFRHFQSWSMAFENLGAEGSSQLEGFNNFLTRPFFPTELGTDPYDGLFLLLSFKKRALNLITNAAAGETKQAWK